jgi:hypothetical protein
MKCVRSSLAFVALLLSTEGMLAQRDLQGVNKPADGVAIARCQYAPADNACVGGNESGRVKHDDATLAQFPRRIPGPPIRPRGAYARYPSRASYPGMWAGEGSGRRAVIGALVGLGLGAAIGTRGDARTSFAFAVLGAGCGAGLGASLPPLPARSRYRGPWPDEDELAWRRGQGSGVSDRWSVISGSWSEAGNESRDADRRVGMPRLE